jgi:NAD binding domain of 6-phosphogluconate dehydrogenase
MQCRLSTAQLIAPADAACTNRRVIMLVMAGKPVDATIELLLEHLEEGDCIIDGGNEWYSILLPCPDAPDVSATHAEGAMACATLGFPPRAPWTPLHTVQV